MIGIYHGILYVVYGLRGLFNISSLSLFKVHEIINIVINFILKIIMKISPLRILE